MCGSPSEVQLPNFRTWRGYMQTCKTLEMCTFFFPLLYLSSVSTPICWYAGNQFSILIFITHFTSALIS